MHDTSRLWRPLLVVMILVLVTPACGRSTSPQATPTNTLYPTCTAYPTHTPQPEPTNTPVPTDTLMPTPERTSVRVVARAAYRNSSGFDPASAMGGHYAVFTLWS